MRRGLKLVLVVAAVLVLAGCLSPLPADDEVDYGDRWNTTEDVTYFIEDDTFTAVVRVDSLNDTEFEVWQRDPFGGDNPVQVAGVRFRDDEDEVTEIDADNIDRSGDRTVVTLPETEGRIAYVAEKTGTEFSHPSPVTGSVRVHLPPGTDARNFFLGRISPGDYETASENPLELRWGEVERGTYVGVEYYNEGYPWIFVGAFILLILAAGGAVYYYRGVIDSLRSDRERREP